ncbi:MAG: PPC domain-containing protein [Planctomycetota bacterium]|nr:PPC domain-containing protein [Planctomycetota bacterium]
MKCRTWKILAPLSLLLAGPALAEPEAAFEEAERAEQGVRGFSFQPPLGQFVETEPNDAFAAADVIDFSNRRVKEGRITLSVGESDFFQFSAVAGEVVTITTTPLAFLPDSFLEPDTVVSLFNPSQTSIASNDDAGSDFPIANTRGSVVRAVISTTGTHYIRVVGFSGADQGDYMLTVSRASASTVDWTETFNDGSAEADILPIKSVGPTVGLAGTEGANITQDNYRLELTAGDVVTATVTPAGGGLGSPDVSLRVLDPNNTSLVLSTDDFAGGTAIGATVRFRAPRTGTYQLEVRDENDSTFAVYYLITSLIPGQPCPGDSDGSGVVDFVDIVTILQNWLETCP